MHSPVLAPVYAFNFVMEQRLLHHTLISYHYLLPAEEPSIPYPQPVHSCWQAAGGDEGFPILGLDFHLQHLPALQADQFHFEALDRKSVV